nr:Chain C, THR-PRO-GLN-SER-ALA-PRO-HIS-GLY-VAL [Severe acute respiratory syndrome coronavirus 2]8HT1_C Chain C, THR-PRO-GLN-SER-ALA-PRO-HIS-GLY-VAL [Severe acute respiratory syndrome coronavirus 2]
TPQSAPHGV